MSNKDFIKELWEYIDAQKELIQNCIIGVSTAVNAEENMFYNYKEHIKLRGKREQLEVVTSILKKLEDKYDIKVKND